MWISYVCFSLLQLGNQLPGMADLCTRVAGTGHFRSASWCAVSSAGWDMSAMYSIYCINSDINELVSLVTSDGTTSTSVEMIVEWYHTTRHNLGPLTNMDVAWITNYIHYNVWEEITYPFPNFNGYTVEAWEWISNFILYFTGHVITYPCCDLA